MGYIAAAFILISLIYILSFAKYNLKKKNKRAFAGAVLLAFLIIALPVLVMLMK
ncbi:MAG TPA: hypothetical protein PLL98_12165 [Bacillota bacterium]|nr:hypothetical protein [Bacillota bacterium]HOR87222.1 hypothetical protein [Bacillota bacterium]HPL53761.1 hypothetical protein [Bacillota bacterium]